MILGALLCAAVLVDGDDPICLARTFKPGNADVYHVCVSPAGRPSNLGNPFDVTVRVMHGPAIVAGGAPSPYESPRLLAKWAPLASGLPASPAVSSQGFGFLPFALGTNDASLKPKEAEAVGGGSIEMLSDKDSVAQIHVRMPCGKGLLMDEQSDVEVATRRINQARGMTYQQVGGRLVPYQSFSLERVRTGAIDPIPQPGGA